jgi:hypothetical protein
MKNNRGQALILFVLFIPLLCFISAFVIDSGLMIKNKIKLDDTTKIIIKEVFDNKENSEDIARNLYKENNFSTEKFKYKIDGNILYIENEITVESIFGGVIGLQDYNIKSKYKAYLDGDVLIIEKNKE